MLMERLPITLVPQELRRMNVSPVPSYRAIYNAVLDNRIPALCGANGRWTVARDDLRKIVEALRRQQYGE